MGITIPPDSATLLISSLSDPTLTGVSTLLHDPYIFTFMLLSLFCLYWLASKDTRHVALISCALFLATFLGLAIKEMAQQPRMCEAYPSKVHCPQDYSFPSLHAAAAFSIALCFLRSRAFLPLLAIALLVSLSRIYLGVHTFFDMAGALGVSLVAYYACLFAWGLLKIKLPKAALAL
ncbi:phosphatase PAP2 family protein [Candidatus Micrarchaeota archaeon]|nr:phosphatase PAP2 family protein [Candidatus Micrarchaeota archaeon]